MLKLPSFVQLMTSPISLSFAVLVLAASANAGSRPDSHAPISVMGEHDHKKGEFMISYRFMTMAMEENRDGNNRLSTSEVLRGPGNTGAYAVAPLEMTMDMHMIGLMYAPSDTLTLMLMTSQLDNTMDHEITAGFPNPAIAGTQFTTESSGIGDTKLSGIWKVAEPHDGAKLFINFGLSIPTASIDETDIIPADMSTTGESQLPFPMQLGSGTYDLLPGITYTQLKENYSWGMQLSSVVRNGENDNDYTLGNRYKLQAWHATPINHNVSLSIRTQYESWEDIDGLDSTSSIPVANMMGLTVPTVDPSLRAGERLDIALGANTIFGEGEHRVAFEFAMPAYQYLDGPQLETDSVLTVGYQKAF